MSYNFKQIEKKWQKKWEKKKIFEPEIDKKRKKFFGTFAYPYINGYSHIGHLYSISRLEVFARYKRLKGFNVLFPQGWHVTGSPIVSSAKRIKEKEPKQIKIMKDMGIKDKDLKNFEKPEYWVKFFAPEFKKDYSALGLSIDWRRNFITSSLNPSYDKFIKWQFRKLKEKGLVDKGRHPVVWDPKVNMPVGDHDRIKGEGETPKDFIWVKFRLKNSDLILMAGTTRPDALLAQTHLWIDPKATYKIVKVKNEKWVVGEEAVNKIEEQYGKVKVIGEIKSKELMGKWVKGPLVDYSLYIVPAWFIDAKVGTGIVYSALEDPVDLIEIQDIQKDLEKLKSYKLDLEIVKKLKPISIIKVPGMSNNLGQDLISKYVIKSSKEFKKIKEAKDELNKSVYRKGVMKKNCGKYSKISVEKAQELIKKDLIKNKDAVMFYELTGEVISRNLTKCIVKIVSDQWFIKYGDQKWKKQVHGSIKTMKFYPETVRSQFEYVIDWLNDWACTREYGLGTKLPFDEKWVIEALSDSTIYMAYYTIAHLIKEIPIKEVNDGFFDYVFLGEGKGKKKWNKLKEEFNYWYPLDFRNSGKDLVQNHLTFFLFNHVAIFPKKYWPKTIGVNGWVKVDSQKMSKSLGNFILLRDMMDKFGADSSRLTILNGGERVEDPNWDSNFANSLNSKFDGIYNLILSNYGKGRKDTRSIDLFVESSLNKTIKEATGFMEETLFRSAIQKIFFDLNSLMKKYLSRTDNNPNKKIFENLANSYLIMLSPFCPHITEELWEKLGNKEFISLEKWPKVDEKKINEKFEKEEKYVEKLIDDINHILNIVKEKSSNETKKVFVYTLPKEREIYENEKDVIGKRTGLKAEIYSVNDKNKYDPENKSKKAKPNKPAIYLE